MTSPVPEDVPAADLKRVAEKIAGEYLRFNISCQRLYADVLQALEAERARCATIADDPARNVVWSPREIAAAIRGTHG